ncbi:MAG: hypothetical protein ACLU0O_05285 [Collinsella sp.]
MGATGKTSRFFENTVAEIMLAGEDSPLALRRTRPQPYAPLTCPPASTRATPASSRPRTQPSWVAVCA